MSDTWVVQFKSPVGTPYDWVNADESVTRLLTSNELDSFHTLCINCGAKLVLVEVSPGYGWRFKINIGQQPSHPLYKKICDFVRNLNK